MAQSEAREDRDLTFLVTDIEDSTALWEHDAASMERLLARHDELLYGAVEGHGGTVFKGTGDGILSVFDDPSAAVAAAKEAQEALAAEAWSPQQTLRVRMGVDTGPAQERSGDYFGQPLNRVMRIMSSGHGGQVLLTEATKSAADALTVELGAYDYKGIGRITVHQLVLDGPQEFPELRTDRTPPAITRAGFGQSIHGYDLRQMLGEGDFGIVYQAYQPGIGREVAIKVIRPEYANQPSFIKRFEIEAKFVAQLEHPYIVPLYDFWRDPDGAYIVMRLLKGGSLRQSLDRAAWNPHAAVRLIDQVGAALSYAHRNGVIHRDLKPANVLLDEDGNGYLSDFGIATRLVDETGLPVSSSRAYISPEELAGRRLTVQSDIYNLGVLVYEMLTGRRPRFGATLPTVTDDRPDLPSALDPVIARATAADPEERHSRVEDLIDALREALGEAREAAPTESVRLHAIRNPYKGLRAFQETDRADFFGRDHLVDEIIETVRDQPLTAVVGPSGSGKSSVVKAGLLPAVRSGALTSSRDWLIADMFPGSYPFEELGAALMRVAVDRPSNLFDDLATDERGLVRASKRVLPDDGSGLLLLIDQFEEVFSLASVKDRELFLASLVALAGDARSRVKTVLTLRADYFGYPLDYPDFAPLVRAGLVAVAMPNEQELSDAVIRPADAVGLNLEPGLVNEIVSDVAEQPGGLPLMQYALTELYRQREGRNLTIRAYRSSGGVLGALGTRAETIFQGLDGQSKAAARQLFLRLVSVDEHSDDTRRRVKRADLDTLGIDHDALDGVIEEFGQYRLLTFDVDPMTRGPTVEVAHEALIREWERLDGWIGEHREDLILERRLDDAMREWETGSRDASYLLRGSRLEQFEGWSAGSAVRLTDQQRAFLDASKEARAAEEAKEVARQEHERMLELRSQRRLRILVAVMAVAAVVAAVLGFFAVRQADEAETQREIAVEQRDAADQLRMTAEEQRAILDQQVVAFEAAALAESALALAFADNVADRVAAVRLAKESIAAAESAGIPPDRAVSALHIALQELGVQFPSGLLDSTVVDTPQGLRGVFVLPVQTLFDLADEANIGELTIDQCQRHLGTDCPTTPPHERIAQEVMTSNVLDARRVHPLLRGTDLRYDSTFAFRRQSVGAVRLDLSAGYFEELAAFGDVVGVDPTSENLTSSGQSAVADYVLLESGSVAAINSTIDQGGQFSSIGLAEFEAAIGISRPDEADQPIGLSPINVEEWLDPSQLAAKEPQEVTEVLRSNLGLTALWFAWEPWVVWYRTDVFSQAGIAPPASWDELLAASDSLAAAGTAPWCYGGGGPFGAGYLVTLASAIMLGFEGPEFYDDWLAHRIPADDERAIAAFLRIEELLFTEGRLDTDRAFAARRPWSSPLGDLARADPPCAMWFAPSDEAGTIDAPLDFMRLPGAPGESSVIISGSAVLFNTDRPETRQLARWITLPNFGESYSREGSSVAANVRLRLSPNDQYPETSGRLADVVSSALGEQSMRVGPYSQFWLPDDLLFVLEAGIDRWLEQGPDVLPEALAEFEAAWQEWEAEQED